MSENEEGFVRALVVKLLGRLEASVGRLMKKLLSDPAARAALVAEKRGAVLARVEVEGLSFALVLEPKELLDELTEVEREVVARLGRGLGNDGIAKARRRSYFTVGNQFRKIFKKLGVRSRTGVARCVGLALEETLRERLSAEGEDGADGR